MRKSFWLWLIVSLTFIVGQECYGQFTPEQQHNIDSLNAVIANPNSDDTSLAGAYVVLSEILYLSNFDTLLSLSLKAKDISERALKKSNSATVGSSLYTILALVTNNMGYYYNIKGQLGKAITYHNRSLDQFREVNDQQGIADCLNNLGNIYMNQGKIVKALDYLNQSLKINENLDNKSGIGNQLSNLGTIYTTRRI